MRNWAFREKIVRQKREAILRQVCLTIEGFIRFSVLCKEHGLSPAP